MKTTTTKRHPRSSPISPDAVVPNPRLVKDYMRRHRRLAALVPSICRRARQEFGDEAELILDLYRDHESDDTFLILRVRLSEYPNNLMERIDQVWQEFGEKLSKASGWLTITSDFRRISPNHGV